MYKITLPLFVFFLISCEKKIEKRRIGDKIIEGIFINDSLADGTVKYYTLEGKLDCIIHIKNGKNNGIATYFYSNGKIYDSVYYVDNLPEGNHYRYDSNANLVYQDYYNKGKRIGEKLSYETEKLIKYEFFDSNSIIIYSSDYDLKGVKSWKFKSILNIYTEDIRVKNTLQKYVKFYWLAPPQVSIEYTLGIVDTVRNIDKDLTNLNRSGIVKDTILPILDYPNCYYIKALYSDSVNNFHKIYIQEF